MGRRSIFWGIVFWAFCAGGKAEAQAFVKSEGFEWRVIGRVLFDGGVFRSDSAALGNGVDIGDLRLGAVMRFLEDWQGRVEIGYADSKVSLKDVYIAWQRNAHTVKAGHYFETFGIENRVATTTYRLMNMSVTDKTFGDRRKLGVSYGYDVHAWTVGGGIFSDGDVDNAKSLDEGYTVAAKVTGRPVYDKEKLVHLGVSARFSEHDKAENREFVFTGGAPTSVLNKETNRFLQATVTDVVNQWRWEADVILLYGRYYIQSEWIAARVNRAGVHDYTGKGGYVQAGYLLLGDRQYTYNRAQGWVNNPAPGNLELLLRYNVTDLNDRKAGIRGGRAQDVTFGANYFINKYVAVRLNYTCFFTDRYALNGKETVDFVQGRLQFSF